jgi:GNAT superfamily N-acetyltransferase
LRLAPEGAIGRLTSARLAEAVQLLSAAFIDEPLIAAILPDPAERVRLIPFYFEHVIRHGLSYGQIYVTEPLAGVAIWIPPPLAEPILPAGDRLLPFDLPALLGPAAINRLARLSHGFERSRWRSAPRPHSHVMVLGVDPARQRQGIGSALLGWLLARREVGSMTCCLQTSRPELLPFYQRHGFTVGQEDLEPTTDLRFWTLTRPAQASEPTLHQ